MSIFLRVLPSWHKRSPVFLEAASKTKAVIIRNHGVVAVGGDIDEARPVVESLEEWSKILMVAKIFGGAKYHL